MHIAVTGATGFLGRHIVSDLVAEGHECRCWHRSTSDRGGLESCAERLTWVPGQLGDDAASRQLVDGCDAVVHAALYRAGAAFRGGESDVRTFVETNLLGTLTLMEAARAAGASRFVFISSCAVHEKILDDRPLDETHPLWSTSHYGAHKAALEKFVHSYGLGDGYDICALRPCGIYGIARPVANSKWYELVRAVAQGGPVTCQRGGKEVHAADVARAARLLLTADGIAGEAFNCCDQYISQFDVATMAKSLSGSDSQIDGQPTRPKHQIETGKLRALGMRFGGTALLEETVGQLLATV